MCDLEVVDVHVEIGGQQRERRQLALLVEHRYPDLHQFGRTGCPGREADPGRPGSLQPLKQAGTITVHHLGTNGFQRGDQVRQHLVDGRGVLTADIGPDARMPGGHPGHVAESPGGQTQHGGVLGGSGRGDAHQRGGREVGYVGHDGHQRVVPIGRQGDDLGAQGRDHGPDPRQGVSVGRRGRGQHPGGVYEHLGVGAVDALLLGAGHRVAADVAGVGHRVDHRCLHAAHVCH